MYTINHCPACYSTDVTLQPAQLAQFVVWKATSEFAYNHLPADAITCNCCGFIGSSLRLTDDEEFNLYKDYRGEEYTNKRIFCEPWYQEYLNNFNPTEYFTGRKIGINKLLDRYLDLSMVESVLDYGGYNGNLIPERFNNCKRYVHDISRVALLPDIFRFNPRTDNGKMDVVMCSHVLEHKSDPDTLIQDIKRSAKKDAWIYIEVPNLDVPMLPGGVFHEHINSWSLSSIRALLARHNIDVIDSTVELDYLCVLARQKMKKIVYVTGCLGFIGYHVTKKCLDAGYYVYGVDKQTYAANPQFLPDLLKNSQFKYSDCDINDIERLVDCDYVINTAAETHVDNSIVKNDVFLKSNINGVHHLLTLIQEKGIYSKPTLLHFSTDEVYGDIVEGSHNETDLLKPSNPYSATKAAADMLVLAWARTYNIPYIIVRPTNNYGVGQYVEKLIPKSVKYLTLGRKIDLHDKGTPRRTWLHVSDTAAAVLRIIESGVKNDIFNISGNYEESNLIVVQKIMNLFGGITDHASHISDLQRPGQDVRYSIDDSKLKSLGWQPTANFDQELAVIVEYYKNNFVW